MKTSTLDLLILQVWHWREQNTEKYDLLRDLTIRVGTLARTMLQGEKYGIQAINVAMIALQIYEGNSKPQTFSTICRATSRDLKLEIEKARAKFPKNDLMLAALTEELGELAEAFELEDSEKIAKESLQVACVAVRIAEEGDSTFTGASEESKQK